MKAFDLHFSRLHYFILFAFVVIESSLSVMLPSPEWMPHLSMVWMIFIALDFGEIRAFLIGLFVGFLLDILSPSFFGLNVLIYSIGAFVLGLLDDVVFIETRVAQVLVPLFFMSMIGMIYFFMLPMDGTENRFLIFFQHMRHSQIWSTAFFSPFLYSFYQKIVYPMGKER